MTLPDRSQQDDPRSPLPGLGLAAVARGWVPRLAIALCALMATLAFASASAWAVQGHTFSTSFAGSSEHALAKPKGLAINQQTGQVYVVDSANNRVETFSASGTFLSAFGKAGTGTKGGEFKEPTEIAVDNSGGLTEGDVAVVDAGNKRVEIFNPEGAFLKEVSRTEINAILANGGKGGLEGIVGVAIDGSGDVWIWTKKSGGNAESATMYALPIGGPLEFRFDSGSSVVAGLAVTGGGNMLIGNGSGVAQQGPAGEALGTIGLTTGEHSGQTQGLTVNLQNGDVYVDRGVEIAHFPSPTSTSEGRSDSVGSSGAGKLSAGSGIAIAEATDDVYVADTAENRVNVYTPTTLATATLKPAANVHETTAELTGEVNPEGLPVSDCEFEYGEANSGQYPNSVACSPTPGPGTVAEPVSAQLNGLTPGGQYDARLSVTNANGTSYSQRVDAFRTVFPLEVNTAGSGSGSVECEVGKSGHFEPCAFGYAFFTDLALKATASPGSTFTEWSGGSGNASSCDEQTGVCEFVMGFEPTAITAIFGNPAAIDFPLTVKQTGSGSGTVSCEVQGSGTLEEPCSAEYPEGTSLVITETPAVGSTFAGWSGACASAGTEAQCTLTIDAPESLTAEFTETLLPAFALEIKKVGTGTGTVTSSPPGIDCGAECSHDFFEGEEVELKAAAEPGSKFEGWSGACSGAGTCRVLMSEAKGVEVAFGVTAAFPLTVVTIGKGKVSSSPAGIECDPETACTDELEGEVTLTAVAETGYQFAGWLGCKYLTATTCKVDVTDEAEVTAVFLKSGSEGPQGHEGKEGGEGPEGKEGKEGSAGKEGATGKEGPAGNEGAAGAGERGPAGADGSPGTPGAQGPVGTAGPTGAQGPAGPAGKVELVTCATVKQKGTHVRRCTTKLVTGTATFNAGSPTARASAVLSRHGAVFATGAAQLTHGRLSLRLLPLKRLRAGRYTLTLVTGHGAHEHIRNQAFVLLPRRALRSHPSTP